MFQLKRTDRSNNGRQRRCGFVIFCHTTVGMYSFYVGLNGSFALGQLAQGLPPKLLKKKSRNTMSRRLTFCLPTIMLFCSGAPKPWLVLSYQWTMLTVETSMFHLQCIFLSEICCSKKKKAAENGHIFHFLSVFQRSVTHSRVALEAHQAVTIKARVFCMRVRSFSILVCIILAVASIYNFFWKSRVFPNFFWVVLHQQPIRSLRETHTLGQNISLFRIMVFDFCRDHEIVLSTISKD
jgi:hypothetical protein